MEEEASQFFNSLRKKYFPPSLNCIDAHLTLFHALPNENDIVDTVKDLCNHQESFVVEIKEVVSIGKGTAYKTESTELAQLHKSLQNKWQQFLSPQDRQKLWPHITVQNKVTPEEARKVLHELKSSFVPFSAMATGLQLWEYLGGPWKLIENFVFAGKKMQN